MPYSRNYFMYMLYAVLAAYTAYTYLWSRFGLGVTAALQYVLLCLVLLGLCKYFFAPSSAKNTFVNWLIVLWISQLLGFYLGNSAYTTQLKECSFVLLIAAPFISMRYNPKHNKYIMIALSVISVAMFFVSMSLMYLENENAYGGGYYSLVALPILLYFTRNKSLKVQVICSGVIVILVLMSVKRGDILSCFLSIIVYFAVFQRLKKFDFRLLLAFIFLVFIGYFAYDYLLHNSPLFASRIRETLEGNSSGRDIIYDSLWHYFLNAPFDVQLFGGGFDASVQIAGNRAHSDWLEVLTCEGIIGVILYFGAFLSLFIQIRKCANISDKAVLSAILTIWFVKSMFSMFIFSQPSILLFALTGYILNKQIDRQYEY